MKPNGSRYRRPDGWTAAALTGILVVAALALSGEDRRLPGKRPPAVQSEPIAGPAVRLAGVVVHAQRPGLAEILDLILDDVPASEPGNVSGAASTQLSADRDRIAAILQRHSADSDRIGRIASALSEEGRRQGIGTLLLVGVLLTENPWLDPRVTSFMGARGLMQVMPFHAGKWGCASDDLFEIESNICHGVRILASALRESRDLSSALLRYNGCVRGTNTPDCHLYAGKVYRRASESERETGSVAPALAPFRALASASRKAAATRTRHTSRAPAPIVLPRELFVD